MCAPRRCARPPIARRRLAVFIARPAAPAAPAAARAWLRIGATGFRCRVRSAAGRTFSNRTLKAGWAGRYLHTSVVDAAGAIYVISGYGNTGTTSFHDVWASTDGGARAGLGPGGVGGGFSRGYLGGTTGVLGGTKG